MMRNTKMCFRAMTIFLLVLLCASNARQVKAADDAWTAVGLQGIKITALAIDPKSPATLYAATSESGIFKGVDAGGNWAAANSGLTFTPVLAGRDGITAVAIDPKNSGTLYATADDNGVFKSLDGGESWNAINNGLMELGILSIAIDPQTPTTLYAGTSNGIVFTSVDGGTSWREPRNSHSIAGLVQAIAVDPVTPSVVYAASNFQFQVDEEGELSNLGGISKSENGGRRWNAADSGLSSHVISSLAIDPDVPATLFAGVGNKVFKSTSGGGIWFEASSGLSGSIGLSDRVRAVVVDPKAPTTLYAGTTQGVFKSVNGGNRWSALNDGLTDLRVTTLVHSSSSPATVYAGTEHGGVFSILLPLKIGSASVRGRKLFVFGDSFDRGAVVLVNGEEQRTRNDSESLGAKLVAARAGRRIDPGQTVTLQVRNSDGTLSPEFTFTRPVE